MHIRECNAEFSQNIIYTCAIQNEAHGEYEREKRICIKEDGEREKERERSQRDSSRHISLLSL